MLTLLNGKLIPLLTIGNYSLLVAPSQSGKTTRVEKLKDQLQSKYLTIDIDISKLVEQNSKPEHFWRNFLLVFKSKHYELTGKTLPSDIPETSELILMIYSTIGSPFNISNKILSPYFTKDEVYELFKQYETQENIKIDDQIKDYIFEQTNGAQGFFEINTS